MAAFIDVLRTTYSDLTTSERRVADYIIANPRDVTRFTLSDLARFSEVGVGTIGRLCSKLGYAGFPDLKVALAAQLLTGEKSEYVAPQPENPLTPLVQGLAQAGINNIMDTLTRLEWSKWELACNAIALAKEVVIYALDPFTAAIADNMSGRLLNFGIRSHAISDSTKCRASASLLDSSSVVCGISLDGNGSALAEALGVARRRGAYTILLTNGAQAAMAEVADSIFVFGVRQLGASEEAFASFTGLLMITDALILSMEKLRSIERKEQDPFSAPSAAQDEQLDEMRIGVPNLPISLDPHQELTTRALRIFPLVFETLVTRDPPAADASLVPELAEAWQRLDERTLEITLRRDVVWHDGTHLTADDVVYTFQRILAPIASQDATAIQRWPLAEVTKLDDYRVRLTTQYPDPILELRLSYLYIIPAHVHQQTVSPSFDMGNLIGTGPYRFRTWLPSNYMSFVANPYYQRGQVPARHVMVQAVPDAATRVRAFLNHQLDLITDVSPTSLSELIHDKDMHIDSVLRMAMYVLAFNMEAPPLDKLAMRKALSLAIDRQALIEQVWRGYAVHPRGFQFPGEAYYEPERAFTPYDPIAAVRLLEEANYTGEPIIFVITKPDYYILNTTYAQAIAEMWRKVGVNVELKFDLRTARVPDTITHFHVIDSSIGSFGDPVSYLVDLIANTDEQLPSLSWSKTESSRRYFDLSKRGQQIMDRGERQALFRQLRDELEAEVPITPLVIPERIYAMRSNVAYHADEQFSFDLHPHSFFNH